MGFVKRILGNEIVRRYVIMNSFDGALTMLGIILANFFAGTNNVQLVILPSVGAAIALCISGIWGAYTAEFAEVKRSIKELENHMLRKMHNTHYAQKERIMAYTISVVNGLVPLFVAFILITPFFFVKFNILTIKLGYYTSLTAVSVALFGFGMFAGKTAKENLYIHGVKMLFAGIIIGVIFYLLTLVGVI
jgi:predicted membrane protein (TIGR00267 family)